MWIGWLSCCTRAVRAYETNVALQAGFLPILLGPRVLRTETAAIAGIAALQTLWGDFQ